MRYQKILFGVALVVASVGSVNVQAALINRGGGMIYDQGYDLTWLQDANMAGAMNWDQATDWANELDFAGYTDWRLPITPYRVTTAPPVTNSANCSTAYWVALLATTSATPRVSSTSKPMRTGLVRSMRPIPSTRGSSIPTMAASSAPLRAFSTTHGQSAPDK